MLVVVVAAFLGHHYWENGTLQRLVGDNVSEPLGSKSIRDGVSNQTTTFENEVDSYLNVLDEQDAKRERERAIVEAEAARAKFDR